MQADKQHQWKINVQARAKNFDFKFKATSIVPTWKFHRISILLKLRKFLFKVKSDSGTATPKQQPRSSKSKSLRILEKIRARSSKNQANAAKKTPKTLNFPDPESKFPLNTSRRFSYEEPICIGSVLVGVVAFLYRSIFEKDQKGIIIYISSSIIFLFLAFLFKKYVTGKTSYLLVLLVVGTMVCSLLFDLKSYLNYDEGYVSERVRRAWNYAASSG